MKKALYGNKVTVVGATGFPLSINDIMQKKNKLVHEVIRIVNSVLREARKILTIVKLKSRSNRFRLCLVCE